MGKQTDLTLPPFDKDKCSKILYKTPVREKITELFEIYYNDVSEILDIATIENNGIRPRGVTNEIFSCFHHVVRGLSKMSQITDEDEQSTVFLKEIESGKRHLKRSMLDCYKIAINSFLTEQKELKETLAFLKVIEDFEKYIENGLDTLNAINELEVKIKEEYRTAKKLERFGHFNEAVEHFNNVLKSCYDQRVKIKKFTQNKTYLAAQKKQAREIHDRQKSNRYIIIAAIVSATLSSILTIVLSSLF